MSKQTSRDDLKDALQQMDNYDFEHLIADLWVERGWDTEVSNKSADRGVDVKATREDDGFETTAVIQAKRFQAGNTVGSPLIQQYASLRRQEDADLSVVVTTSSFSNQAESLADDLNVKLVDGDDLVSFIEDQQAEGILERYGLFNKDANEPDEASIKGKRLLGS